MSTPLQARLARKTLEILNGIEKKLPNIKDNLKFGLKTAFSYAEKVKKRVQGAVSNIDSDDTKQNILNKIEEIQHFIRSEITRLPNQNKDFDNVIKALDKIVETLSSNKKSDPPAKKARAVVAPKAAENTTSKTRGRKKRNTDNDDKTVSANEKKRTRRKKNNTVTNDEINENSSLPLENSN